MEHRYLVVVFGVLVFHISVLTFPLGDELNGLLQGGSETISDVCTCDLVAFWLPGRSGSTTSLPSYESYTPGPKKTQIFARNTEKRRRFTLPKDCKLSLNKDGALHGISFENKNPTDSYVEVSLRNSFSCVSFWMKCQQKSFCVGIDDVQGDFMLSAKRKLLMVVTPDDKKKQITYQPYGIVFGGLLLCAMVILIAMCGTGSRKACDQVVYSGQHQSVEILSSQKVKYVPQQDSSERYTKKEENQKAVASRLDNAEDAVTGNSNSNITTKTLSDENMVSVDLNDPGTHKATVPDATDGQVFGKRHANMKEKEENGEEGMNEYEEIKLEINTQNKKKYKDQEEKQDKAEQKKKEKEQKKKDKEAEKKMKLEERKRSREEELINENREGERMRSSSQATEKTESKKHSKKLRLSLKGASPGEDQKSVKKEKKKSKKKSQSDDISPEGSPPMIPSNTSRNRRSFINRELPERPPDHVATSTNDDCYAEPFDRKIPADSAANNDAEDDEDAYETVETKNIAVMRPARSSPNVSGQDRTSANGKLDHEDHVFYDSPYQKSGHQTKTGSLGKKSGIESDTYEVVEESTKRTLSEPMPETNTQGLYETVETKNKLDVYEQPRLPRQRSASDVVNARSSPRTEPERKAGSLEREVVAPTPPPLDNLKVVVQSNELHDAIEPYTITQRRGDIIVQEISSTMIPKTLKAPLPLSPPVTPEQLERMYAKVDKEKQKKDRMEMEMQLEQEIMKRKDSPELVVETNDDNSLLPKAGVVSGEEHGYDDIPTLETNSAPMIKSEPEGEQLYDEVILQSNASSKETTMV